MICIACDVEMSLKVSDADGTGLWPIWTLDRDLPPDQLVIAYLRIDESETTSPTELELVGTIAGSSHASASCFAALRS
jgi:hypothetical protein